MKKTSSNRPADQVSTRGLPGLASVALLSLAMTGCVSMPGKSTDSAAADPAATAPASTVSEDPVVAEPAGMRYDEVAAALKLPIERARQTLVGQQVSVDLQRDASKGAPANRYVVQVGDTYFFRCLSSAANFGGGPVTAEVRTVRMPTSGATRTVELAHCAGDGLPQAAASTKPVPAARPAAQAAAAPGAAAGSARPGMDAQGNVIDSSKVESGSGRTVQGINDYEGEITGNPAPGSKFTRLQIGMPIKQVTDLIGQPSDQGAYMTGKAWIPFYFGGDRHRYELVYKGQGRLIFAGGGLGDFTSGNLIWIIHNAQEGGYR
ncbi:MAG: hypothetical protein RBR77_10445 [Thauera sp.]|jgi:hypothetical protein|nr:hypothetical protein [Thauera sp.]